MPKDFQALLDRYQGNAYPAMLETLSTHLGVSSDSLIKLGLGWVPVVDFKKGKNFQGWWAIPERDDDAKVVGLSLRSQNDMKVMFPGSNHGLTYEVNPTHEGGIRGYEAGASNWVRAMDAGTVCPVCGKPDGCLFSAENPSDPKAVICIRIQKGATKPLRFGWLHILRAEGNIQKTLALGGEDPIIVVEGMSDTAAAMDLGYTAVGKPSNVAGIPLLVNLLRGRKVIVVGENDKKSDGKEPGREGMITTFHALKSSCKEVSMLMPPEHVKDLRAWKSKFGLTRTMFEDYFTTHGQSYAEELLLPNPQPLTISRAWLNHSYKAGKRYTLREYNGEWYDFDGSRYRAKKDQAIRGEIYKWADNKQAMHQTQAGEVPKPLACNITLVNNMLDAALSESHIESPAIPAWINGREGPDARDLITFSNGILHVPSYLSGESERKYLLDPTADYFTLFAAPYPFDPTAIAPLWNTFLGESLGDDPGKIALLQEWVGYCMVPDVSMHKMMVLHGKPRSGKGTILHAMEQVVGTNQTSVTNFKKLTSNFGPAQLVGSLIAVMPDAHLSRATDSIMALEVLKSIVGGDSQGIDVKFQEGHKSLQLKTRFTIAVNELPDLPDYAGALLPRLNLLDFAVSFAGREDTSLWAKLETEVAGIAVWGLEGLRRLREQGRFTVPVSSEPMMSRWAAHTNPVVEFVDEVCEKVPGAAITKEELNDAWVRWSSEHKVGHVGKTQFLERIARVAGYTVSDVLHQNRRSIGVLRNIQLQDWAARKYLGRP